MKDLHYVCEALAPVGLDVRVIFLTPLDEESLTYDVMHRRRWEIPARLTKVISKSGEVSVALAMLINPATAGNVRIFSTVNTTSPDETFIAAWDGEALKFFLMQDLKQLAAVAA